MENTNFLYKDCGGMSPNDKDYADAFKYVYTNVPVFTYDPIALHTERGREEIIVENPTYVQKPLIQAVVDHLLGKSVCGCDCESATLTHWVMDKILNKL